MIGFIPKYFSFVSIYVSTPSRVGMWQELIYVVNIIVGGQPTDNAVNQLSLLYSIVLNAKLALIKLKLLTQPREPDSGYV